jgi:hypothetical protein
VAKGQKRSGREAKKPKKKAEKPIAGASPVPIQPSKTSAYSYSKKK